MEGKEGKIFCQSMTDDERRNVFGEGYFAYLAKTSKTVSYTHLRAHETDSYLVCRLLLEKKKYPSTRDGLLSRMPLSA